MEKFKGPIALALSEGMTKLIGLILLPLITASLSLEEFGVYALFLVNYIFFMALYVAILNNFVLVRYFNRGGRVVFESRGAIFFNILFFLFLLLIFLPFSIIFDLWNYFLIFIISSFSCLISQPAQIFLTIKQCRQEYSSYAKFSLVYIICYAALAVFAFIIGLSNWYEFALLIFLSHTIQTAFLFFNEKRAVTAIIISRNRSLSEYVKHFRGLLANSIFGWARVNVDKYFVLTIIGSAALATYSLGFQLGAVIGLLNTILIKILNPILFSSFKSQETQKAKKVTLLMLIAFILITLIYIALVPYVVDWFFNDDYIDSVYIAQLVSAGYLLQVFVSIFGAVLFYERRNYLISVLSIFSFLVLLLSLFSIFKLGLFNANNVAICFVFSWLVHFLLTSYFALKEPLFKGFISNG